MRYLYLLVLILTISDCDCGGSQNPGLDDITVELCDNDVDDNEDGLTDCEDKVCRLKEACRFIPPDPNGIALPLDPTNLINFSDSIEFLYTGENAIIRGLDPSALELENIGVLRSKVVDKEGKGVAGIMAHIAGNPKLGYTFSRENGEIDLVANGGQDVVLRIAAEGFLSVDRKVEMPKRDYQSTAKIVLTLKDEKVSDIDEEGGGAQASEVSDNDGTRSAKIWFPEDTVATLHLPDGQKADLKQFKVRMTEYTLGESGLDAMPALLPTDSAYTYATELSLDEAEEVGAEKVTFNKTAYFYVDNFLSFPVGKIVPSGVYDRARYEWEAIDNGRVAVRLDTGIDLDGDGKSDDITSSEEAAIETFFDIGQSFWRVPVNSFSPHDLNWPQEFPNGALPPVQFDPVPDTNDQDPCTESGSIIECQNQVLMKSIALPGTKHRLFYRSDHVAGRHRAFELKLTGSQVAPVLKKVRVLIKIRGRVIEEEFVPTPNLTYKFEWDGKDAYGREVFGKSQIQVIVSNIYDMQYTNPADLEKTFGLKGLEALGPARKDAAWSTRFIGSFGAYDARANLNMGGWALDVQHAYDGAFQTHYLPDAPERNSSDISRIIENFELFENSDGVDIKHSQERGTPYQRINTFTGSDDSLYYLFTSGNVSLIFHQGLDGKIEHIAGKPVPNSEVGPACVQGGKCLGEGGPPQDTIILGHWILGPDDAFYSSYGNCIRRIKETVEVIVGNCGWSSNSDLPDLDTIAIGPNSELYASDGNAIYQFYPGETRYDTLAGCNLIRDSVCKVFEGYASNVNALNTDISVKEMVVAPDGRLYYLHRGGSQNDLGIKTLIRLNDGKLERLSETDEAFGIAVGPDGAIYFFDQIYENGAQGIFLKRFKDGKESILAGTHLQIDSYLESIREGNIGTEDQEVLAASFAAYLLRALIADGIPPNEAHMNPTGAPAVNKRGDIFFGTNFETSGSESGEQVGPLIKRITNAFPNTINGDEALLAAQTARHLYRFDAQGRVLEFISAWNGLVLERFKYSNDGLISIVDRDQLETKIIRDSAGTLTAIVGPFGHRTEFDFDPAGYLNTVTYPDGSTRSAVYSNLGLMTEWSDGEGNKSQYSYDLSGHLIRAENAEGGWKTFTQKDDTVVFESSTGRRSVYQTKKSGTRFISQKTTRSSGLKDETIISRQGKETTLANGTLKTSQYSNDPRFGAQSPFVGIRKTKTPSGLEQISERRRIVVLSDAKDLLSLKTLSEHVNINGKETTYTYDRESHSMTKSSPMGRKTLTKYNDKNRVKSIKVGTLSPVEFTYNSDGKLIKTKFGEVETTVGIGSDGLPSSVEDGLGQRRTILRDSVGRVIETTAPNGDQSQAEYNNNGMLSLLRSDANTEFQTQYNGLLNLTELLFPSGDKDEFTWLDKERLKGFKAANGQTHTILYDQANRVNGWTSTRGASQRVYDDTTGNVRYSQSPDASEDLFYDGFIISGRDISFEGQKHEIRRIHDNNFRLIQRSVAGLTIDFEFDDDGNPIKAGDATLEIDTENPLLKSLTLGTIKTELTWDNLGRIDKLTYLDGSDILFSLDYQLNALSQIVGIDEDIQGATSRLDYAYDSKGQLISVLQDNNPVGEYDYDARGNRIKVNATTGIYDISDRIERFGSRTYTTDASGFVKSWTQGGQTTNLDYDGSDLISVNTNGKTITYGYDTLGRRVWRKVDGAFDKGWLYDDTGRPFGEVDGNGDLSSRFIYATANSIPTYMTRGGKTYRFLTEINGTVRMVVDSSNGQIVQKIEYTPLGKVKSDTNPGFQPFAYASGLYDAETGLMRMGSRDYDPEVGRWLARDPLYFGGGDLNLFVYCGNDGISRFDSDGHAWFAVIIAAEVAFIYVVSVHDLAFNENHLPKVDENNRRARKIGKKMGLTSVDAENAIRHCVGQCEYKRVNGVLATAAGWWHEEPLIPGALGGGSITNEPYGSTYRDRLKDEHNNTCGRDNADDPRPCIESCTQDLKSGELATDQNTPYVMVLN